VTDEQIRALGFYERSPLFDAREKSVILFADRLTRSAAPVRDAALQDIKQHLSEDQLVELALVVCMANFTNRFNDGLRLEADIG
jgi:alkylhydroperoxidase family enzyme